MAFGNGAPDVFSAIAAIQNAKDGDAGLAFGALFGAGIFVSTVVCGTICIIKPFQSVQRPLLRDIIVFMVAGFWAFKVVWDGYITTFETLGFLILYLIYIIIIIGGRYVNQRIKRARGILSRRNDFSSASVESNIVVKERINESDDSNPIINQDSYDDYDESRPLMSPQLSAMNTQKLPLTREIINGLKVFTRNDWDEANIFTKILLIIKVCLGNAFSLTQKTSHYSS